MENTLKILFGELNWYWCNTKVPEKNFENSEYINIQKQILEEIAKMDVNETIKLIDELSDAQINQIVSVIEYIIMIHPETKHIFKRINEERNIYSLNNRGLKVQF